MSESSMADEIKSFNEGCRQIQRRHLELRSRLEGLRLNFKEHWEKADGEAKHKIQELKRQREDRTRDIDEDLARLLLVRRKLWWDLYYQNIAFEYRVLDPNQHNFCSGCGRRLVDIAETVHEVELEPGLIHKIHKVCGDEIVRAFEHANGIRTHYDARIIMFGLLNLCA
jgi:predicted Fe-S protein YdhL (DUF1289 family)